MSVLEDLKQLERQVVSRAAELRGAVEEFDQLRQVAARLGIDLDQPQPAAKASTPSRRRRTSGRRGAKRTRRASSTAAKPATRAAASKSTPKRTPGGSRGGSRRDDVL